MGTTVADGRSHREAAERWRSNGNQRGGGISDGGSQRGGHVGGGEGEELGHGTERSEAPVSSPNQRARGESKEGNGAEGGSVPRRGKKNGRGRGRGRARA
jgi:hypothetical protein